MKILLSPAKSIDEQGEFPLVNFSKPLFSKEAKQLVLRLKKMKPIELMDLMHVSKDIAELNSIRYKNWHLSDTPTDQVKPAGFLFSGEVYRGLDIKSFSESELDRAQHTIRILSGMYGLLKPLDLIFPYRLEMSTKLNLDEKTNNLYQFWGEKLSKNLLAEMTKDECVVNLASTEYSKAIIVKSFKNKVVSPIFKEFKNGEYKVVMMYAKHARGKMAQFIVSNNIHEVEELKKYTEDGYCYMDQLSSDNEWVFVR